MALITNYYITLVTLITLITLSLYDLLTDSRRRNPDSLNTDRNPVSTPKGTQSQPRQKPCLYPAETQQ
jgi:hypothetical protein